MNGEESPGWGGDGIGRQESAGGARGLAGGNGGLGGAERREAERGCVFIFFRTDSIQLVPPRLYYNFIYTNRKSVL